MKILMLNKFHYLKGGSERHYFGLIRLLEQHGHTVIPFAMQSERNVSSPYADHFVPNVEYAGPMSVGQRVSTAARTIYYPLARRNMEQLIAETQPDIVHAHNIYHQLSYAPLHAAHRHGIPVVLTAHDFKLVCPNNAFLCGGQVCEKCAGGNYMSALLRRCGKGRLSESLIMAAEMYFNRVLFDVMKKIDLVITPSRFMREKFLEYGIPADKVLHHFNLLELADYTPRYGGDGSIVYLGRLSREKGIATLVRAMKRVPDVRLRVLGEGDERASLERFVADERMTNVEVLGYRDGQELQEMVRNASFSVVPSEWYENSPYSVVESFALGKPVIGSRIGGIPELIEDGKTGYLFTPGNAEELAEKIAALAADPNRAIEFGREARSRVERDFDPEGHYQFIAATYRRLIESDRPQA